MIAVAQQAALTVNAPDRYRGPVREGHLMPAGRDVDPDKPVGGSHHFGRAAVNPGPPAG